MMVVQGSGVADHAVGASVVHAEGGKAVLPSLQVLTDGSYDRLGPDLVITAQDGHQYVVRGFFTTDPAPSLVTADGHGELPGSLAVRLAGAMAPGQVADASGGEQLAQAEPPIGTIQSLKGAVTIQHQDGTTSEATVGSPVYQGDLLTSGDSSGVGIVFADGTEFSLGAKAKMVLDEMVYDPASGDGSSKFSLLSGTFSFVSGQVAKSSPDAMTISTPVATIGIRGTTGSLSVDGSNQGPGLVLVLLPDPTGSVGEIHVVGLSGQAFTLNQPMNGFSLTSGASQTFVLSASGFQSLFGQVLSLLSSSSAIGTQINSIAPSENRYESPTPLKGQDGQGASNDAPSNDGTDQVIRVTSVTTITNSNTQTALQVAEDIVQSLGGTPISVILGGTFAAPVVGRLISETQTTFGISPEQDNSLNSTSNSGNTTSNDVPLVYVTVTGSTPYSVSTSAESYSIKGDASDNTITTGSGSDTLDGGAGNDLLQANDGNNMVIGGSGTDTLVASPGGGSDVFYGGESDGTTDDSQSDWLLYTSTTSGVSVALQGASGLSTAYGVGTGSEIGTDLIYGIEHVAGGSGNDILRGNSSNNTLLGNVGSDTLDGGAGNDVLNGGAGTDTVTYANGGTLGVTIDWSAAASGAMTVTDSFGDTDTLISIEAVIGTAFADSFKDGSGNETMRGGAGNDTYVWTGNGNDTITDSAGTADKLDISDLSGSITLTVYHDGTGNLVFADDSSNTLVITAGAGIETLLDTESVLRTLVESSATVVTGTAGADLIIGYNGAGQTIYAGAGADAVFAGNGNDVIYSENAAGGGSATDHLHGGAGNDTIYGGSGANILYGDNGNDTLYGNGGGDTVFGGNGNDVLVAALGTGSSDVYYGGDELSDTSLNDWLDISGASSAVSVSLQGSYKTSAYDYGTASGAVGNDTLYGIEHVKTGSGNDSLEGNSAANSLIAGAGDDTLEGGGGADVLDGGTGTDTVTYEHDTAGVTVNLSTGTAVDGGGSTDTLIGIENATGSDHNDQLTDNSGNNVLKGGAGDDTYTWSGSGTDTIAEVSGSDTLQLTSISSGTTVSFGRTSGNNIMLTAGSTGTLELILGTTGIETVVLQDGASYTLVSAADGSSTNDLIVAGMTGGIYRGGLGKDILYGGDATDTLYAGSSDNDSLDTGSDVLYGGSGDDELHGNAGDNTLHDGAGNDALIGGDGDDSYVWSGVGNDTVADTAGSDTLDLSGLDSSKSLAFSYDGTNGFRVTYDHSNSISWYSSGYQVAPTTIVMPNGSTWAPIVSSSGLVTGTSGDDLIIGTGSGQTMKGWGGTDTLVGGDGDDYLYAGGGYNDSSDTSNDTLFGGAGQDSLSGNYGNNVLNGGADSDWLAGGNGDDTYVISGDSFGWDSLQDSSGADRIDMSEVTLDLRGVSLSSNTLTIDFESTATNKIAITSFSSTSVSHVVMSDGTYTLGHNTGTSGNDFVLLDNGLVSSFNSGAGNDRVFVSSASLNVAISLGDGNDHFYSDPNNDNSLTMIDGGSGTDIFHVQATGQDYSSVSLTGFEGLELGAAVTGVETSVAFANALDTFTAHSTAAIRWEINGSGSYDLSGITFTSEGGGAISTRITGSSSPATDDTIIGSSVSDTIFLYGGNDSVSGGSGDDQIRIQFGTGSSAQSISIDGGAGTKDEVTFQDVGTTGSTGVTVHLDTGVVTASSSVVAGGATYTLSNVEMVMGSVGDDTYIGSSGSDIIEGYWGNDTLTGGAGADLFTFTAYSSISEVSLYAGNDVITDWTSGEDKIALAQTTSSGSLFNVWDGSGTLNYFEGTTSLGAPTPVVIGVGGAAIYASYDSGSNSVGIWYTSNASAANDANSYQIATLQHTDLSQIDASDIVNAASL